MNKKKWLALFKAEFLRKTGITWNEDAGMEDNDAIERYYPDNVTESVNHHINKYDMDDITDSIY